MGSGPFRFVKDEWQPGNQVVYVKHADYVPRNEAPSGSTGGKKVHLDKVVWRYIPDPATAAAALAAGEVDWWEIPPIDFVPKIEQNAALATFLPDPRRHPGLAAPEPPASALQQQEGAAGAGRHDGPEPVSAGRRSAQAKYYRTCHSVFACNGPYATKAGAEGLAKQNLREARQLVKESGYDGRPVTVVHVTDIAFLSTAPPW